MFTVYILYSFQHNKTYVGYTSNLIERFRSHNYFGKDAWTCRYRPWVVVHVEVWSDKSEAISREKELKTGKGRDWIKNHIEHWKTAFK